MTRAKLSIHSSVYASSYSEGHVYAEINAYLQLLGEDGEEIGYWEEDDKEVARGNLKMTVSCRQGGQCVTSSLSFDCHRANSARLAHAARLMEACEKREKAMNEEDGEPSSLAEALRRAAKILGATHLKISGPEKETSVQQGSIPEEARLKDLSHLAAGWLKRLDTIASEVQAKDAAEREIKEQQAA